ncbi:hypothetical protein BD311DRAFT_80401 [Dichomitus squalens]|uniref:Uncharacterized protein n=1 Tax=Dichomitus squalens TaxID=114155 RepID=A0A4Q9MVB7_9APHY|nr:hypothetical protein BD311DRAFT_80401 [Dichomitus squalens]
MPSKSSAARYRLARRIAPAVLRSWFPVYRQTDASVFRIVIHAFPSSDYVASASLVCLSLLPLTLMFPSLLSFKGLRYIRTHPHMLSCCITTSPSPRCFTSLSARACILIVRLSWSPSTLLLFQPCISSSSSHTTSLPSTTI